MLQRRDNHQVGPSLFKQTVMDQSGAVRSRLAPRRVYRIVLCRMYARIAFHMMIFDCTTLVN
jgi:hypothetical protein